MSNSTFEFALRERKKKRSASRPAPFFPAASSISSATSSIVTIVPRALAHLHELAAAVEEDELVEERLEPLARQPERAERVPHPRHVAVVVGAER